MYIAEIAPANAIWKYFSKQHPANRSPAQQFVGINVVLYYAGSIFKGKSLEEMEHIWKKRPKQTMEDALLTNAEF
jgi:hypothetical protein